MFACTSLGIAAYLASRFLHLERPLAEAIRHVLGSSTHEFLEKLVEIVPDAFETDKLPHNHELQKASLDCLKSAGLYLADALLVEADPALSPPSLWNRFLRLLTRRDRISLGSPETAWVKRLVAALHDEQKLKDFDNAWLHPTGKPLSLMGENPDVAVASQLHERFGAWVKMHVGEDQQPAKFREYLERGWPLPGGELTLFRAYCLFFREQVKHDQSIFNLLAAESLAVINVQLANLKPGSEPIRLDFDQFRDRFTGWLSEQLGELRAWLDEHLGDICKRINGLDVKLDKLLVGQLRTEESIGELHEKVDRIDKRLDPPTLSGSPPVDARALRDYLDALVKDCAPLKLKGIDQGAGKPNTEPLGLTSVYVDLNLNLRVPKHVSLTEHLKAEKRGMSESAPSVKMNPELREADRETRLVSVLEAVGHHEKLVLLGAPGSGKSTLTYLVALSLAEAGLGDPDALKRLGEWWKFGALLPVRVVLRQFAASLPVGSKKGRAHDLWQFIEGDLSKSGLSPAAAAIPHQMATQSGALFLFDGLDETRDESTRARMLEAVAEFTRTAGRHCRFILTARPYAWDDFKASAPSRQAERDPNDPKPAPSELAQMHTAYRLADFEPGQINLFIERWYAAVQKAGWPVSEPGKKIRELQEAVRREDLSRLARNPLLLTLMATLHSNRARLPDDRADLYNEVVELLLQRWNENIGADRGLLDALKIPTLTLAHLRKAIQKLAFEVHEAHVGKDGVADIPEGALLERLRPLLSDDTAKADVALHYIEQRAGLLIGQGEKGLQRQYTFPHRTFQEFLAACHLAGQNNFCATALRLARQNPAHWREVLTLAARRAEADRGVPVADALVHGHDFKEWSAHHTPVDIDWRASIVAAEQLLEIGLAAVEGEEHHRVVRDRIAGWLAALLEHGALPVREREQAGNALAKLGDPRSGVRLKDGLPDIDWVKLPAGKFKLGQTREDVPVKEFQLSRYPITVAQYQAFVDDPDGYQQERFWKDKTDAPGMLDWWNENKDKGPKNYDPVFQTPNHPRVGVCWYEAAAFCRWLTERLNAGRAALPRRRDQNDVSGGAPPPYLEIRLPHEKEWEWAARCVQTKDATGKVIKVEAHNFKFPWGSDDEKDLGQRCNCHQTGIGHTSAVGLFPSGKADCGALDLAGNVWEWCENWYDEKAKSTRVLRGGSWYVGLPEDLRTSYRNLALPVYRDDFTGFRLVVVSGVARQAGL